MSTRNWGGGHRRREQKRVGKSGELPQELAGKDLRESLGGTNSEASMVSDEAIGISGVLNAIEGVQFPSSRSDIVSHLRGKSIPSWRGGEAIDFEDLLSSHDEDGFGSKLSFMSFVSERLRDRRESSARVREESFGGDRSSSGGV